MNEWRNWAGNQRCSPRRFHTPQNEIELQRIVQQSDDPLRAVGASHSFSALVPSDSTLVSLKNLAGVVTTDQNREATCYAGTRLCNLGDALWDRGLSLSIQGDVDPQSMAGAFATGTHGSGIHHGCLAESLRGFRLILADGTAIDCDDQTNPEVFAAGRVSLGTLGIMTQVRVQCESKFHLREKLWSLPKDECLERLPELLNEHRSFEFFAFPTSSRLLAHSQDVSNGPVKRSPLNLDNFFLWSSSECAHWARPLGRLLTRAVTHWLPADTSVDRSYRVFANSRNVKFHEMEYSIPADAVVECFREIDREIQRQSFQVAFPIEVRWVRGDDCWISPFFQRDSATISVHRYHKRPFRDFFATLEPIFARFGGRPHWGKLHGLNHRQLRSLYPKWDDFLELRARLDPQARFVNSHVQNLLGVER